MPPQRTLRSSKRSVSPLEPNPPTQTVTRRTTRSMSREPSPDTSTLNTPAPTKVTKKRNARTAAASKQRSNTKNARRRAQSTKTRSPSIEAEKNQFTPVSPIMEERENEGSPSAQLLVEQRSVPEATRDDTNGVMESLPNQDVEEIAKDSEDLRASVQQHNVPEAVNTSDDSNGSMKRTPYCLVFPATATCEEIVITDIDYIDELRRKVLQDLRTRSTQTHIKPGEDSREGISTHIPSTLDQTNDEDMDVDDDAASNNPKEVETSLRRVVTPPQVTPTPEGFWSKMKKLVSSPFTFRGSQGQSITEAADAAFTDRNEADIPRFTFEHSLNLGNTPSRVPTLPLLGDTPSKVQSHRNFEQTPSPVPRSRKVGQTPSTAPALMRRSKHTPRLMTPKPIPKSKSPVKSAFTNRVQAYRDTSTASLSPAEAEQERLNKVRDRLDSMNPEERERYEQKAIETAQMWQDKRARHEAAFARSAKKEVRFALTTAEEPGGQTVDYIGFGRKPALFNGALQSGSGSTNDIGGLRSYRQAQVEDESAGQSHSHPELSSGKKRPFDENEDADGESVNPPERKKKKRKVPTPGTYRAPSPNSSSSSEDEDEGQSVFQGGYQGHSRSESQSVVQGDYQSNTQSNAECGRTYSADVYIDDSCMDDWSDSSEEGAKEAEEEAAPPPPPKPSHAQLPLKSSGLDKYKPTVPSKLRHVTEMSPLQVEKERNNKENATPIGKLEQYFREYVESGEWPGARVVGDDQGDDEGDDLAAEINFEFEQAGLSYMT